MAKIGLVCPYNYFIPGGVQEHVRAQAEGLEKRGHEVTVITPRPSNYRKEPPPNVTFVGVSRRFRSPQNTSPDWSAADGEKVAGLLENRAFDIVHIHEPAQPLLGRQIIDKANCPVVGTLHATPPKNAVGKSIMSSLTPYMRNLVRQLDAVTVVSEAAAEMIGMEEDYEVISNGVDLAKYKPLDVQRKPDSVLYVGRLEKRKGVRYLLAAFAELQTRMPDVSLDIAGDGPIRRSLEFKVETEELKNVKFHGFVEEDEKRRLLAECGVFTSPAIYGESFGIVLLEAMAMGSGVVAADNVGYASVMSGRGAMSLVNPTDPKTYARAMELFLTDPELVDLWRKWAVEHIKQYDYPKIIDQYEALYKKLLGHEH